MFSCKATASLFSGVGGVCGFGLREQKNRQEVCFWWCCVLCRCLRAVLLADAEDVTLSSTEAENVAMAEGLKEAIFLRHIYLEVIFPDRDEVGCTMVHEDVVGALHLATNPVTTPSSKPIDARPSPTPFLREPFRSKGSLGPLMCGWVAPFKLSHKTVPHESILRVPQRCDGYFIFFLFASSYYLFCFAIVAGFFFVCLMFFALLSPLVELRC